MKKITLLLFALFATVVVMQAQTLDADLKAKQAELAAAQTALDELAGAVADLESQIETNAGWVKGYSGILGFDLNKSNNWVAAPNRDASSSSLNLGLSAYANNVTESFFWRNSASLTKSWQDVDLSNADGTIDDDGLFDNGTVDILNISSLAGKPISDLIALSGLGELNTSISNFLDPGTLDLGVGVTLTPDIDDLVVVIHPLNYTLAFSKQGGFENTGALGAKIRADFRRDFGKVNVQSVFTSFLPYSDKKQNLFVGTPQAFEGGLSYYQWINTVSFNVWNGIGVGISLGLRNASFESPDSQNFYSVGLSYSL